MVGLKLHGRHSFHLNQGEATKIRETQDVSITILRKQKGENQSQRAFEACQRFAFNQSCSLFLGHAFTHSSGVSHPRCPVSTP